jgi:hypothetical protein
VIKSDRAGNIATTVAALPPALTFCFPNVNAPVSLYLIRQHEFLV